MQLSDGRILTTHAGSLPRPTGLTRMYAERAAGRPVDPAALEAAVAEATREVVERQAACGIDVGNNGEQGREGFFLYVQHRLSGFGGSWKRPVQRDILNYPEFQALRQAMMGGRPAVSNFETPTAIGEVRYTAEGAMDAECDAFAAAMRDASVTFAEPFVTAPSPGIVAAALQNRWYDSFEAYLNGVAEALRVEYEAIHRHGYLLQLDCPDLALERHVGYADKPLSEFIGFVELVVEAINRAIRNVPRDRVRLHVCWGNYEGPHDLDVPLADILPAIARAEVGGFMFPQANPRHAHEYRHFNPSIMKDDQVLIAGVVDTTSNFVEHPEVIADRLERAARAVGDPARVIAGTDCGFDTSAGMGRVARDVVWAKLKAMSEGAAIASDRLFRGG